MDRATVDIYEANAGRWLDRRPLRDDERDRARAFSARVPAGAMRVDLGCGPGRYAGLLGSPRVGLDAARAMLVLHKNREPAVPVVQADLAALPFRRGALGAAWANCCYQHLPAAALPMALADLHRSLAVGAPVAVMIHGGDREGHLPGTDFPGRYVASWSAPRLIDLFTGAGFDHIGVEEVGALYVTATRSPTLPDTVGPAMRLLVCGLNPSVYAAAAGVGYARPANRFWAAAVAAGLVDRTRDPRAALRHHGIGMTDLVKRATVAAAELSAAEFRAGLERVGRLVAWLRPGAVCFVGLGGWRAAGHPRAQPGPQPETLGDRPVYVMPSTSGRNARTSRDALADHMRRALATRQ